MMKKAKWTFKIGILLLVLLFEKGNLLLSQTYTETRRIVKTYHISPSTTVDVTNKYGKIHVVPWTKDSVKLDILLTINSSSTTRLSKIKENIDFDFTSTKYYIVASTVFGSRYNTFFSDLKSIAESFLSVENEVNINYTIYTPSWSNLKIDNKFGDIFLDDMEGDIDIKLSNGDLKANNLSGYTLLNLNSADGVMNYVENGKFIISYSDLLVKKANQISIDSRSSKITLQYIDYMKAKSRRDKYNIDLINKMLGESYFSDLYITNLNKEVSFDLTYGNISFSKINKNFSLINLNSEYTDLDLVFESGSSYELDLTHYNEVIFNYPREISKLEEKLIDEEDKQFLVWGTIGTGSPSSKVRINILKKCYLNIYHK